MDRVILPVSSAISMYQESGFDFEYKSLAVTTSVEPGGRVTFHMPVSVSFLKERVLEAASLTPIVTKPDEGVQEVKGGGGTKKSSDGTAGSWEQRNLSSMT